MPYICSQCDAAEGEQHKINCFFEGQKVQNAAQIIEAKLWEFVCSGGGDGDFIREIAAELAEELGL